MTKVKCLESFEIEMFVHPSYQVTYAGNDIRIYCYSDTPVRWSKDGSEIHHGVNVFSIFLDILFLINVTELDNGNYTCHGRQPNNTFDGRSEVFVGGK